MDQQRNSLGRPLSMQELELVAGGATGDTVWGQREDPVPILEFPWMTFTTPFEQPPETPTIEAGNGMDAAHAEKLAKIAHATRDWLADYVKAHPDVAVQVKIGDHVVDAAQVLKDVDTLLTALDGGMLVFGIASGDKDIADAIGFVVGLTVTAALADGATPFVVAGAIGLLATNIAEAGAREIGVAYYGVTQTVDIAIKNWSDANPLPGDYPTQMDYFNALFGQPQTHVGPFPSPIP